MSFVEYTLTARTEGTITSNSDNSLTDVSTLQPAVIPEKCIVTKISISREGETELTDGITLIIGTPDNMQRYITPSDNLNTDNLNLTAGTYNLISNKIITGLQIMTSSNTPIVARALVSDCTEGTILVSVTYDQYF